MPRALPRRWGTLMRSVTTPRSPHTGPKPAVCGRQRSRANRIPSNSKRRSSGSYPMRSSALRLGTAALAVLAGCRTLPPAPPPSASWEVRRPQLQSLTHFQLRGRVAVAAGGEGFNANLHWTQDGARSEVTLEGPLGVGGAQLTATGDELTVVTSR